MTNVNFKNYTKVDISSTKNNNELVEKIEYFEKLKIDSD